MADGIARSHYENVPILALVCVAGFRESKQKAAKCQLQQLRWCFRA
jgi:hypothetical protein